MEEIREVMKKYDASYIGEHFHTTEDVSKFATTFYKDAAEIYDCLTRIKNVDRNPTGFSLEDAPILGLLVRSWKLFKELIKYHEADNAEIISLLERPLIEASVVATYLLNGDSTDIEDYRKCSYKDRLRILRDLEAGSAFYETKAGKRLLKAVRRKMAFENLTAADFEVQKKNRWRIGGKTFYDIFATVVNEDLYACTYGMMSESIHGSWNDSMDFCLFKNDDGSFTGCPFHHPADIRYLSPTLRFMDAPFRLWIKRIDAEDAYLVSALDWIARVNSALYMKFDDTYDG